jgi:putative membrane protein
VTQVHAVFSHWSASWPAAGCYAVVALAHLAGLRRLLTAAGDPARVRELRSQAVVFQGGLLVALLALVSPIGHWSDVYIWVRAIQFLLLAFVSTGLMVLGAPWLALRAALPSRGPARAAAGPRTGEPGQPGTQPVPGKRRSPGREPWLLARPGITVVAVNAVWLAWQLPLLFDSAKTSSGVALACHASYLAAGLMLWLQLIGSRPFSPVTPPLRRVRLVVGTVGATTVLGMVLVFGSGVLYPAYAGAAHHVMTVLDDQQLAGAVIWMGSLPPLISAAVALLLRWLSDEESAELSAGLDRLLTPRKNAWSARPGIR